MTSVRESSNPTEYAVEDGKYLDSFWVKKLKKSFKKTIHPWERVHKSLKDEYRFFDTASLQYKGRYNPLSYSSDTKFALVKHEVKIPQLKKSASGGGYRAGLLVEIGKKVVILFVGHHENYKKLKKGSDLVCFKHLLKIYYPTYYDLFYKQKG